MNCLLAIARMQSEHLFMRIFSGASQVSFLPQAGNTRMPYLAQQPKDHEASEAAGGQAEGDELNGMGGGWVGPGSHFSNDMRRGC